MTFPEAQPQKRGGIASGKAEPFRTVRWQATIGNIPVLNN